MGKKATTKLRVKAATINPNKVDKKKIKRGERHNVLKARGTKSGIDKRRERPVSKGDEEPELHDVTKKTKRKKLLEGEVEFDRKSDSVPGLVKKHKKSTMSMDEFLGGGFLKDKGEEDDESSSSEEDEKRKTLQAEEEEESSSSDEDEEEHQKQLDALAAKDPEFFEHLEKHEKELLDFEAHTREVVISEDEEEEAQIPGTKKKLPISVSLAKTMLKAGLVTKSKKGIRSLVQAFSACSSMVRAQAEEDTSNKYVIVDPEVYKLLVDNTLRSFHVGLRELVGLDETEKVVSKAKHWNRHKAMVKSFLASISQILVHTTDASMKVFILQKSRNFAVFYAGFNGVARLHLKGLIHIWATSEEATVQLTAFLRLRQLVLLTKNNLLGTALRESYLSFVRNAKFSSPHVAERITLQAQCLTELFGLDMDASYELAFIYIRQLALHLRKALSSASTTADALKQVYCWKFIHCLKLWGSVLCLHDGLHELIYPLVQITLGVIQLVPSARHFPLHLHCMELLVKLDRVTTTYIPVGFYLVKVLTMDEVHKKPLNNSEAKAPDLDHVLRVKKDEVLYTPTREVLVSRALKLLRMHIEAYQCEVFFPEFLAPLTTSLKQFAKMARVGRWRVQVKSMLAGFERVAKDIEQQRKGAKFGPGDLDKVEAFAEQGRQALQDQLVQENQDTVQRFTEMKEGVEKQAEQEPGVEEDLQVVHKKKKKQRRSKKPLKEDGMASDDEDRVEAFVMSESEESE